MLVKLGLPSYVQTLPFPDITKNVNMSATYIFRSTDLSNGKYEQACCPENILTGAFKRLESIDPTECRYACQYASLL